MLMEIESKVYTDEDVEVSGDALFPIPNLKKKNHSDTIKAQCLGLFKNLQNVSERKITLISK